jgi:hypothetical protein
LELKNATVPTEIVLYGFNRDVIQSSIDKIKKLGKLKILDLPDSPAGLNSLYNDQENVMPMFINSMTAKWLNFTNMQAVGND